MRFHVFMLPTSGTPDELARGMAGQRDDYYRRALDEVGRIARFADDAGYAGIGFTEHHFHIEGFEISTNPVLLDLYVASMTRRIRVGQLGIVLPASNPVAEDIAMLDQMSGGRAYAGFARGYQQRWVNTLGQHIHVGATRSDKGEMDAINRAAFEEALESFGFPKGLELVGDPDQVTRQLETLRRDLQFEEVFLWINQGLSPIGEVMRGLELFAERVMPRLA